MQSPPTPTHLKETNCAVLLGSIEDLDQGQKSEGTHRYSRSSIKPDSMNVLVSLMQTMPLGFTPPDHARPGVGLTPPDRAGPGVGHTLKTDFGRGGRPYRYPNRGATMRTFPSDRRLFWRRHVGNTKADDAYLEIEI